MKKYEFIMHFGNIKIYAIIANPIFENGIVRATQVGEISGFTGNQENIYVECEPKEFIAGGGPYYMVEYSS